MNEEQDLKLTDLDYLIGDHHLQMIKAALPFMNVPEQKMTSVFVKFHELTRTVRLFEEEEVATMGICSMDKKPSSPLDMLNAIKPYGNTYEQDLIDVIANFMQGFHLSNAYQSMSAQEGAPNPEQPNGSNSQNGPGSAFSRLPLDQLKAIMPPEQQAKLENMQMLMQMFQQFA